MSERSVSRFFPRYAHSLLLSGPLHYALRARLRRVKGTRGEEEKGVNERRSVWNGWETVTRVPFARPTVPPSFPRFPSPPLYTLFTYNDK